MKLEVTVPLKDCGQHRNGTRLVRSTLLFAGCCFLFCVVVGTGPAARYEIDSIRKRLTALETLVRDFARAESAADIAAAQQAAHENLKRALLATGMDYNMVNSMPCIQATHVPTVGI